MQKCLLQHSVTFHFQRKICKGRRLVLIHNISFGDQSIHSHLAVTGQERLFFQRQENGLQLCLHVLIVTVGFNTGKIQSTSLHNHVDKSDSLQEMLVFQKLFLKQCRYSLNFLGVRLPVLWFYDEIHVNKMERQSLGGMVVKYEPTFNSSGLKKETLFFFPY